MSTRFLRSIGGAMMATFVLAAGCSSNVTTLAEAPPSAAPPSAAPNLAATKSSSGIAWQDTFEDAQQTARQTKKLMMVDFYIDNCPPCKFLETKTYVDKGVIRASKEFVSVKVKATDRTDLMDKYRLSSFPVVMWLDENGKMVHGIMGPYPPALFLKEMKTAQSKLKTQL